MSNAEELLENLRREGHLHSSGRFSLSDNANSLYSQAAQACPGVYLLRAVQFAVAAGAVGLDVKISSRSAAVSLDPGSVSVESFLDPDGPGALHLRWALLTALASGVDPSVDHQPGIEIEFSWPRRDGWRSWWASRSRPSQLKDLLAEVCHLCPIPVTINGEPLFPCPRILSYAEREIIRLRPATDGPRSTLAAAAPGRCQPEWIVWGPGQQLMAGPPDSLVSQLFLWGLGEGAGLDLAANRLSPEIIPLGKVEHDASSPGRLRSGGPFLRTSSPFLLHQGLAVCADLVVAVNYGSRRPSRLFFVVDGVLVGQPLLCEFNDCSFTAFAVDSTIKVDAIGLEVVADETVEAWEDAVENALDVAEEWGAEIPLPLKPGILPSGRYPWEK